MSAALAAGYLFHTKTFRFRKNSFQIDGAILRRILMLGTSSFLTQLSIVVIMGVMNNVLVLYGAKSPYGADIPLTVVGIVMKVFQIVIAVVVGIAAGSQPIIGYNYGAGHNTRVKEIYKTMMLAECAVGLIATVAFECFPLQIVGIFGSESGLYNEFAVLAFRTFLCTIVLGLSGSTGIDEQALKDWASDPDSAYVAITPNDEELEKLFEDLARNIAKPGGTNIVIDETVSPCFRITALDTPSKGEAHLIDNRTLQWKIDELGVDKSEGAVLEFTVEHNGSCSGILEVNESISYKDDEGNVVAFPSPEIEVDCGSVIIGEPCPEPVDIHIDGCEDSVEIDAGNLWLGSTGRIIQLDVTLKNVCPHKRIALAAILTEKDDHGYEHDRGIKILTVPAHTKQSCHDITVRCIKFVLPDQPNILGSGTSFCNDKNLKVRFLANYIDSSFECCKCMI